MSEETRETSERSRFSIFGAASFCADLYPGILSPFGAGAGMQDAPEAPEATGQGERGPFVNRGQILRFDIFCLFFLAKLIFCCFLLIVFAKALET